METLSRLKKLFENNVIKTSYCWIWSGCKEKDGYGVCSPYINGKKKQFRSHRLSWILNVGRIPRNKWVLHRCDNRSCVNPKHLFLGNVRDNTKDMVEKNRQAKGSKCHLSRINEKDVIMIRALSGIGISNKEIAKRTTITPGNIYWIVKKFTWKHV